MLLVGVVEFTSAFDAERRATSAAGALADIVARQESVTPRSVTDLLIASGALLEGPGLTHSVRVSSLALENNGQAAVILWSFGESMPPRNPGTLFALSGLTQGPMKCPSVTAILAEVELFYTPSFGAILGDKPIKFARDAVFCPRTTSPKGVQLNRPS
jgi:hypothetical protein